MSSEPAGAPVLPPPRRSFAQRARTMEGKLQVELAQLSYLLPRLVGQWKHLERLGGGIGTRGPGEQQIESDRRIIRNRIRKISEELRIGDNCRPPPNAHQTPKTKSSCHAKGLNDQNPSG